MKAGPGGRLPSATEVTPLGTLPSKRNRVTLVELVHDRERRLAVAKEHASSTAAAAERDRLLHLAAAGLRVPKPYGLRGSVLYLEQIKGPLLVEAVEQQAPAPRRWCGPLARWLWQLHSLEGGPLKGDVNLRNFILGPGGIWGLDFEELPPGRPEVDLGRICAFILTTRPAFVPGRSQMCRLLLEAYGALAPVGDPWTHCLLELEAMARRRPGERELILRHLEALHHPDRDPGPS